MNRVTRLSLYVVSPFAVIMSASAVFALVGRFLPDTAAPYLVWALLLGGFALVNLWLFTWCRPRK